MKNSGFPKKFIAVCLCVCLVFAFSVASSAADCELSLSDAETHPGMTSDLALTVGNNPGIANGILIIRYDPELLDIDASEITVGAVGERFSIVETKKSAGAVSIGFVDLQNVTDDGIMFVLPFTVRLDAYPTETKIDIEVRELVAEDGSAVPTEQKSSNYTVSYPSGYVKGDVTADGAVDIEDAMLVFYHVAKKYTLPDGRLLAANVDGNNVIDIEDAMRIFYCVAKKTGNL